MNDPPLKHKLNKTLLISGFLILGFCNWRCEGQSAGSKTTVIPGAEQFSAYLGMIKDRKVGLVVNHSSIVNKTHLLDTLVSLKVNVAKIFGPEHGFRGNAADGDVIKDSKDPRTGIPVISLYGSKRKPSQEDLDGIDVLIFDMQDVGTRFYTYSSTMFYAMEACAENNKKMIILDRPNPHGDEVDGPVLDPEFKSFIGLNKIPILHGLTLGEMAMMINGEGWLANGEHCDLSVIKVKNYTHQMPYSLPVRPSPNLPNDQAIAWYPTLALFEGTQISVARGTPFPFQAIGYPDSTLGDFTFTPASIIGVSTHPPHLNEKCYGMDLRNVAAPKGVSVKWVIEFYNKFKDKENFFRSYFNLLAGTDVLMKQIKSGMSEEEIKRTWQDNLNQYKKVRKKYLLYPDNTND